MLPIDPIAAVTHCNPYSYYAELAHHAPFYRDEALGLWIAASAAAVSTVLIDPHCRVRPVAEPVPRALLGTSAANIFRHLIRMNDGAGHCPFKKAASTALITIDDTQAAAQSHKSAMTLKKALLSDPTSNRLTDFCFLLPVYSVATLLGVPAKKLLEVADWIKDFVACLPASASSQAIAQGCHAADSLLDLFGTVLDDQPENGSHTTASLTIALAHQAKQAGCDDRDVIIANAIGFLSQAYEASAGLLGNTIKALVTDADLHTKIIAEPVLLPQLIQEILRADPPVHNTRRFVAQNSVILGQHIAAGESILVLLAAANHDASVNADPQQFDMFRSARRIFTFGLGHHLCPGQALCASIALGGIEALITGDVDLQQLAATISYRPSANIRIPVFSSQAIA